MTPDFEDLMAKAKAARLEERGWYAATDKGIIEQCGVRDAAFINSASPDVLIALLEERERLRAIVKNAFNEGFIEGTKEAFNGGKGWSESKARAALGDET